MKCLFLSPFYPWRFLSTYALLTTSIVVSCCGGSVVQPDKDDSSPVAVSPAATPVVGVLTQPRTLQDNTTEYYVAASYLKWLEVAGARAIPIPYDASNATVDELFQQINGILFPGGGSDLPDSAKRLYELATKSNQEGVFFPIWGTCLGFEYLIMMASFQGESVLQGNFDAENVSLPLELVNEEKTLLYRDSRIRSIATTQNVTLNNHHMGIEPSTFMRDKGLTSLFRITSINHDLNSRPFVSTIEPRNPTLHPFYGVQYHPEKNPFEYGTTKNGNAYESINHSVDGISFSLHLAQFFGTLLQKAILQRERHSYTQPDKYPLVFSYPMKRQVKFEQVYVIPPASSRINEEPLVKMESKSHSQSTTRLRGAKVQDERKGHVTTNM